MDLHQGESGSDLQGIWSLVGASLSKDTSRIKFHEDLIGFSRGMSQIIEKCHISQC